MKPEPARRSRLLDSLHERRERHRERSRVVRVGVVFGGFVVVLAGIAMLVLPGPGLLVIAVGLAVLALEFAWAERLLERTIERMEQATDKVKRASRAQQAVLVLLGTVVAVGVIAAAYFWDIPFLPF